MLYQLLHKVFGWDYIQWRNSADSGISRIHTGYSDHPYYWVYKITENAKQVQTKEQVLWLTCNPEKYMDRED